MNRFLLIGCLLFYSITSFAQTTIFIEGYINDSLKKPLASASITIKKGNDKIIAFSYSNPQGYYKVQVPATEHLMLGVSYIGYETVQKSIDISIAKQQHTFVLKPVTFTLNEVIISEKVKIKQANDTTIFRADAFRDNSEKTVEDLLKKLPGFEVSKNGNITVNGKNIEKILLDGDNLLDRNYKVISKNLSADLINDVQVIDHYNENTLMKGVEHSDRQVLNLTFKDGKNKKLFGVANIGIGNNTRTDNTINLLSISKRIKTYTLGRYNTIGINPLGDIVQSTTIGELEGKGSFFQQWHQSEYVTIGNITSGELNESQANFNNALMIFPSIVSKLSKSTSFRANGYIFKDCNIFKESSSTLFLTANPIDIFENKNINQSPYRASSSIEVVSTPSQRSRIQIKSSWNNNTNSADATTLSNTGISNQLLDNRRVVVNNSVDFTYKLSSKKVFNSSISYEQNTLKQHYGLSFLPKRLMPFQKDSIDTINQQINNSFHTIAGGIQFLTTHKNYTISYKSVFQQTVENAEIDFEKNHSLSNILYTFSDFYAGILLEKNIKDFKILIETPLHIQTGSLQTSTTQYVFLPKIDMLYNKGDHSYSIRYFSTAKPPQIGEINPNYYLSDFRTLQKGATNFMLLKSQNISTSYRYQDVFTQLFIYGSLYYSQNTNIYNQQYILEKGYSLQSFIASDRGNENYGFSAGFTKFIPLLKATIKGSTNVSVYSFQNQLSDIDVRNITSISQINSISLRSSWKKPTNYRVGITFNKSTQHISGLTSFSNLSLNGFGDISFAINSKIQIHSDFEYYSFPNTAIPNYLFLNSRIEYDIIPDRFSINLIAQNITNNQNYNYLSLTDYQKNTREYRLLGQYFLLEANFRF